MCCERPSFAMTGTSMTLLSLSARPESEALHSLENNDMLCLVKEVLQILHSAVSLVADVYLTTIS